MFLKNRTFDRAMKTFKICKFSFVLYYENVVSICCVLCVLLSKKEIPHSLRREPYPHYRPKNFFLVFAFSFLFVFPFCLSFVIDKRDPFCISRPSSIVIYF